MRTLEYQGIEITWIRSRRRTLSLEIHTAEMIILRTPLRCSKRAALQFLRAKDRWLQAKLQHFASEPVIFLGPYTAEEEKRLRRLTRERAAALIRSISQEDRQPPLPQPRKVYIRNQKTLWGSCSSSGNLSLNLRLGELPEHLFRYVVLHELAHLYELNHSAKFWLIVEAWLPDYRNCRKELKRCRIR